MAWIQIGDCAKCGPPFIKKCLNVLPVLQCHLLVTDANNCSIIFQNLLPSCENIGDPNQPADQDLYCLHPHNQSIRN